MFDSSTSSARASKLHASFSYIARRSFPTDPTLENPIVTKFDPSQTPILVYGVSGIDDPIKLCTLLDNEIAPTLESSDGVAAVNVTGGEERAIRRGGGDDPGGDVESALRQLRQGRALAAADGRFGRSGIGELQDHLNCFRSM